MKKTQIINAMQRIADQKQKWDQTQNEGATDGYNPYDDQLDALSESISAAMRSESPLTRDFQGELTWFNAQAFRDVAEAANFCLARGYSLADLQAAAKEAR